MIHVFFCRFSLSLSSDQKMIEAPDLGRVEMIGETAMSGDDDNKCSLTAVAADNHLLLFQGQEAEVCQCIAVPGHAKEFCWVHKEGENTFVFGRWGSQ